MDRLIWAYGQEGVLDFTLFRPFNWIGPGQDSIHMSQDGSSRVVSQFFGHMIRGEEIKLVDGGMQKRAFTYIEDGIDALMSILENKQGVASGKIYNIGNPSNHYSVRELATMMLELAQTYPEYCESAAKVNLTTMTAVDYYGQGYQDMQNRMPKIDNTCQDLGWHPKTLMPDTLKAIFNAYRTQVRAARKLLD